MVGKIILPASLLRQSRLAYPQNNSSLHKLPMVMPLKSSIYCSFEAYDASADHGHTRSGQRITMTRPATCHSCADAVRYIERSVSSTRSSRRETHVALMLRYMPPVQCAQAVTTQKKKEVHPSSIILKAFIVFLSSWQVNLLVLVLLTFRLAWSCEIKLCA